MSEILGRLNRTIEAQGPDDLWVQSRDALALAYQTISDLHERLAASEAVIAKVRAYADDRAFHARGHLNTVNSGRIATDLLNILDAAPSAALAVGASREDDED